jgi:hypothetical protein
MEEFHAGSKQRVTQFPTLPELPDTDAIVAEAEKLNSFVSKEK